MDFVAEKKNKKFWQRGLYLVGSSHQLCEICDPQFSDDKIEVLRSWGKPEVDGRRVGKVNGG